MDGPSSAIVWSLAPATGPLTTTFTIILSSMFYFSPICFALLAGDIVALFVTGWLAFKTRDFKT